MPKRTMLFMPALAILVAAVAWTSRSSLAERAPDCISKPGSTAPQGSHWYSDPIPDIEERLQQLLHDWRRRAALGKSSVASEHVLLFTQVD